MKNSVLVGLLLGGYAVTVFVIGLIANRFSQEQTEAEYFVAGRTFGLFVLFFTYEATLFSMWFFLGTGGFWYLHGVGFYCHALWMTGSALLLYYFGQRLWLVGKKYDFVTPADVLAHRYGSETVRVLTALIGIGFVFPYLLLQIKGAGQLLESATRQPDGSVLVPYALGAALMLIVVVVYTVVGGGRAVGWTDAFQGFLFLVAIWAVALWAVSRVAGGWRPLFDRLARDMPDMLTLPGPSGRFTPLWWFSFWTVQCVALSMPGVWMRIYSARSATMIRRTAALVPLAGIIAYLATFLYAFAGKPFFPNLVAQGVRPDQLLPEMLRAFWPAVALPMVVAAFAAGMSTADSQLLAGSAMLTRDIYKRYVRPEATQAHLVWVGRAFVVVFTSMAYLASLNRSATTLVQLGALAYSGTAHLLLPLIGALFWKRATAAAAVAGPSVGVVSLLLLDARTSPFAFFRVDPYPLPVWSGFLALAVNALVFVVVSLTTSHSPTERHEEYDREFRNAYPRADGK